MLDRVISSFVNRSPSLLISNHYQHPEIWRKFSVNVKKRAKMRSDFKLCLPTISLLIDSRNKISDLVYLLSIISIYQIDFCYYFSFFFRNLLNMPNILLYGWGRNSRFKVTFHQAWLGEVCKLVGMNYLSEVLVFVQLLEK